MKKYDYLTTTLSVPPGTEYLKGLGKHGWKLVNVFQFENYFYAFFIQELAPKRRER